jgi:predicted dehydrogenase
MKFLIAGLGSIGRRHLRNLRLLGEQDIILYRTHTATLPDNELTGYPIETEFSRAMAQKPDAVIVSNPTARHLELAMPAAEAGCAILLEKPVSDTTEGLDLLAAAVKESGSRILVGFQFRFHPSLQKASEMIKNGTLGNLLTVHAHWGEYLPNWHPWEDYRRSYAARSDLGGGVIGTLTHPLDYVRWLAGDVEAIWSFNGHISPLVMDVEDVADIGLRFANTAIGGVHVNYFQRPPVHRLEIVGTKGTLFWDNSDGILHLCQMPGEFGTVDGNPSNFVEEQFTPPAGFERNVMFLEEMRHFISMARGECEPVCTLDDGVSTLKMVLAAKRSASERRIVTLKRNNMKD